MNTILECTDLNKSYGKQHVIRNLSIRLEKNNICGLLGRNGAGKTTLLNMVTGGIFPDSGSIKIEGFILKPGDIPKDVCYVRDKKHYFGSAKVIETLELVSTFHPNWDWDFAHELIKAFKLNPDTKIRQLSKGMVTLVGNIIGLASRSSLTIFDEPMSGLDVLMREKFYRLLMADYAESPRTILISSHLVDEIAPIVERSIIIEKGEIFMDEDVETIRSNSHLLIGSTEAMEEFSSERKILYKESFGKNTICAIYGKIKEEDKIEAKKRGISIESLPLQKFFAYVIEGGGHVE